MVAKVTVRAGLIATLACAAVLAATPTAAADEPWTLASDMPITTRWWSGSRLVDQSVTADLYRPKTTDPAAKVAAAVIVNSSGGVTAHTEHHYARMLAEAGVAALVIDSFGPRGVRATTQDQSLVWQSQSDADAAAGFRWLASQPGIDAARIAVMGMSRGGGAALAAAFLSERRRLRIDDVRFAAHVAIATGGCRTQPQEVATTGAPIFFMLAELDDYTPIAPCLELIGRMRAAGVKGVRLAVYPGVYHAYEGAAGIQELTVELSKPDGCSFLRTETGGLVDRSNGQVIPGRAVRETLLRTCVGQSPVTVGGEPRVKAQASADLLQFLRDAGIVEDREARAAVPDCGTVPAGIARRNCERARAGWTGDLVALARMFRHPKPGLARDDAAALRLFRLAAARGHAAARWELALMLRDGLGGPPDLPEAARLLRLSAEAGEPAAMNSLGLMLRDGVGVSRDEVAAVALLRRAADLRFSYALANLGRMVAEGRGGLAADPAEAVRLWRKAVVQDNPWGQIFLGRALEAGSGAVRDTAEATRLFRAAAAQDRDQSARRQAGIELSRLGATKP